MPPGPSSCSIAISGDARRRGRPSPVPTMAAALPAWISHRHFWR
uniref:Uncharacterized protein n=1 Tax=Pseudomonas aeruginosa TaxID=287 RepID=A0A7U1DYR2_PSEAI|nr:Hypothetical protein [Pseudomonas aeruginosa]